VDQKEGRIMVRTIVLGLVALLAFAGGVSACPFDKTAATTAPTTTESSALPLPTTTDTTETKTGG
jgi:hypothetical protein